MGYSTDFGGSFEINKPLTNELATYINKFAETRRMKRDNEKIKALYPNWKELCLNGELGKEGEYFVGGTGTFGQDWDDSVVEGNGSPITQPGLWCQWIVSDDNKHIEWDGGEKFYEYCEWLQYIIDNFLTPNGYTLSGKVEFWGEDYDDTGVIDIVNNDEVRCRYYEKYLPESGQTMRGGYV